MELLVTLGTQAADRATAPRHSHRVHIDLDTARVDDVAQYAEGDVASITVMVQTWAALRRAVLPLRLVAPTKDVRIRVLDELAPTVFLPRVWPGINGRLVELTTRSQVDSGTTVRIRLSRLVPAHHLVAYVVQDKPSVLTPPLRLALAHRDVEPFAVGSLNARYAGIDDVVTTGGVSVPLTEVVLAPAADGMPGPVDTPQGDTRLHLTLATPRSPTPSGGSEAAFWIPPVDPAVVNPAGFTNGDCTGVARVVVGQDGGADVVDPAGQLLMRVAPRAPLSGTDISRMRPYQYLTWEGRGHEAAIPEAVLLSQLAASGVPVLATRLSGIVRELLGAELTQCLDDVSEGDMDDPLLREATSVRVRRAALRSHGVGPRLRGLAAAVGHPVSDEPTVSIILMTKRPHRLAAALQRLKPQTYPRLQLVLGLHGGGFDAASVAAALQDMPMPCTTVAVPASVSFGEALNRATERCDGRLVSKCDDDDDYGSEHIWDLVLAADYSGADVVGKAAEFTSVVAEGVTVRRNSRWSERVTSHVAGGTLLLRRETLQEVGGWRPQPRYVDDALLRQVRDFGGTVYRTHGFGYVLVRHGEGHTWDVGPEYFLSGDDRRWPTTSPLQDVALEQRWDKAQPVG